VAASNGGQKCQTALMNRPVRRPGRPLGRRHVVDRDAVLDAAETVIARDGPGVSLEAFGREMLVGLVDANLTVLADHRNLFHYVMSGPSDESPKRTLYLAERSTVPLASLLGSRRVGAGAASETAITWAYGVVGMVQLVSLWWLNESDRSSNEVANDLADLLWSGLSTA
jgi:hypothetical protein